MQRIIVFLCAFHNTQIVFLVGNTEKFITFFINFSSAKLEVKTVYKRNEFYSLLNLVQKE